MPTIGKRILKSALAVYLCFCIYILRGGSGIPFYSAIAAIICMQPGVTDSISTAVNRVIGTLIGAFWGTIFLFLLRAFFIGVSPFLLYAFISLGIILVIYSTVVFKKTASSYISTVVFLCITVVHFEDLNPFSFAFNRTLDTLIGIFVALVINYVPHLFRKKQNTLYVIELDQLQAHENKELFDAQTAVKLNILLEQGAHILFTSKLSHCRILPHLNSLKLTLPLICLNGAGLYCIDQTNYIKSTTIDDETTHQIIDIFHELDINCFTSALYHDFLHIYYDRLENPVEERIFDSIVPMFQRHYIDDPCTKRIHALQVLTVQPKAIISQLLEHLETLSGYDNLNLTLEKAHDYEDYYYLSITSKTASIASSIEEIVAEQNIDSVEYIPYVDGDTTVRIIEQNFYHRFLFKNHKNG